MEGQLPPAKVLPMPMIQGQLDQNTVVDTPSDEIGGTNESPAPMVPNIFNPTSSVSPPPNVIGAPAPENSAPRYPGHH
jgi:hypothetical protein